MSSATLIAPDRVQLKALQAESTDYTLAVSNVKDGHACEHGGAGHGRHLPLVPVPVGHGEVGDAGAHRRDGAAVPEG